MNQRSYSNDWRPPDAPAPASARNRGRPTRLRLRQRIGGPEPRRPFIAVVLYGGRVEAVCASTTRQPALLLQMRPPEALAPPAGPPWPLGCRFTAASSAPPGIGSGRKAMLQGGTRRGEQGQHPHRPLRPAGTAAPRRLEGGLVKGDGSYMWTPIVSDSSR
jgi:hypothetical protein